jgi:hypothetical protein
VFSEKEYFFLLVQNSKHFLQEKTRETQQDLYFVARNFTNIFFAIKLAPSISDGTPLGMS